MTFGWVKESSNNSVVDAIELHRIIRGGASCMVRRHSDFAED